jgi:CP family cyanate transporter-like MFS transporter
MLRLLMLWLAGVDLRVTMLAVPPVLPLIHHDLHLSEKAIGLLSGLPVLLLGVAAVPGSLLIARIGARRATIASLIFVAGAAAARGIGPSTAMLFAMTLLMGVGVAVMQPALPTLALEWFDARADFATAVYANGLLIGEAVPAALTIPVILPLAGGSWPADLAAWSLPVAATAMLIALGTRDRSRPAAAAPARWWPDWHSGRTWQLGLLIGGAGGLYFSTNAFIPDYLHAVGRPELVSATLAALNSGQLPASFVALFAITRISRRRATFVATPLLAILGLLCLFARPAWLVILGAGTIGFFGAFTLILSLALPPLLAPVGDVHRLSAGMFAIGYALSCAVPLLGGALWDLTGIPATAFLAAALSAVSVAIAALSLRPWPGAKTSPSDGGGLGGGDRAGSLRSSASTASSPPPRAGRRPDPGAGMT